jgi:hypothetical protein
MCIQCDTNLYDYNIRRSFQSFYSVLFVRQRFETVATEALSHHPLRALGDNEPSFMGHLNRLILSI